MVSVLLVRIIPPLLTVLSTCMAGSPTAVSLLLDTVTL